MILGVGDEGENFHPFPAPGAIQRIDLVDTVDVEAALGRVGGNAVMVPFVFFALTAVVSAMGSPLAGLVMAPVGMPVAKKYGMDPMLMALAIGTGLSAGAFAPTSLFGIVSYGTAQRASIDLSPLTLWAVAVIANFVLLIAAFLIFGGPKLVERRGTFPASIAADASRAPFAWNQIATIVCLIGLIVAVIACSMAGLDPDIGVLSFAFGAALTLIDPNSGRTAVSRIDWSTVLLVGGIVTFVGVLQRMGSVDLLGIAAKSVGVPILAALAICVIAGLVSAFASTTGIPAALVPLAPPVVASGHIAGWALICALAVCSSIVDVSPFSTVGATLVATADEKERPRMTSLLTRWGMFHGGDRPHRPRRYSRAPRRPVGAVTRWSPVSYVRSRSTIPDVRRYRSRTSFDRSRHRAFQSRASGTGRERAWRALSPARWSGIRGLSVIPIAGPSASRTRARNAACDAGPDRYCTTFGWFIDGARASRSNRSRLSLSADRRPREAPDSITSKPNAP